MRRTHLAAVATCLSLSAPSLAQDATGTPAPPASAAAPAAARDAAAPRPAQKVKASAAFGLRLGGVNAWGTRDSGVSALGGGAFGFFDAGAILIDVALDGYFGGGTRQVAAGFGGYVPFGQGTFAPYAGAGLRIAWCDYGHENSHGFQPYAEGGLLFGRLSNVALRGGLQAWWNTFSNDGRKAHGLGWYLGAQF